MQPSDLNSKTHSDLKDTELDGAARSLIKASGMPLKLFSDAVGWSSLQSLDWWSFHGPSLKFKNLNSLAHFLGCSVESLIDGSYDCDLIRQRIFVGPQVLPEKYSNNAHSYVRTSAHIIEYLSMRYGRHFTDNLLLHLEIHPLFFDNLNNRINLNFFIDLFNGLSAKGLSDQEISSLACYIFLKIRNSSLGEKLNDSKTHQEFYEALAENAASFMETNFEYKIQASGDKLRVIAKPTEARIFLEQRSSDESKRFFLYRNNVFNWFPTLVGLSPLSMRAVKCFQEGDSVTIYEAVVPSTFPSFPALIKH